MKMGWISLLISAALLFCSTVTTSSATHSLYYTYTALSKPVHLPGIYEFIALGTLDDRELDYYNSQTQVKVPKQKWMEEKMEQDYWEKGTQSRKSKEQWFKVNVEILMNRMKHNNTDLHVLQWRHGCKIERENGISKFVQGIDEYSYDGAEFLSFDEVNSRWIAPVQAAVQTKDKWDSVDILNQYTKSYLQKECVDWLTKFMDYGQEELRQHSPPKVHLFVKKSLKDSEKLTLTCLATGFFPPDIKVCLRKARTSIPEHLLMSSGVRPNGDGTYQLRKSLDILEDEKAMYDCHVSHITLTEPIIVSHGENIPCLDCSVQVLWGVTSGLIGGLLLALALALGIIFFLIKTGKISWRGNGRSPSSSRNNVDLQASLPEALPVSVLVAPPVPPPASSSAYSSETSINNKDDDPECDSGKGSPTESSAGSQNNMSEENRLLAESDSAAGSSRDGSQKDVSEHTPML